MRDKKVAAQSKGKPMIGLQFLQGVNILRVANAGASATHAAIKVSVTVSIPPNRRALSPPGTDDPTDGKAPSGILRPTRSKH